MSFITTIIHHQYDYWDYNFKFRVDESKKYLILQDFVTELDIKLDIYKDSKQAYSLRDNSKYPFYIRTIGGDATVSGEFAGDLYFMINGYRIVYDPTKVKVTGILYSDDYDTPWLDSETLKPVYPAVVSNLALSREPDLTTIDIPTANDNAKATWEYDSTIVVSDSYGEKIKKLLSFAQFLGLK